MGVLHGSMSYLRFAVIGTVPSNYVEQYESTMEMRRFIPLHPEAEDIDSAGWVPAQKPFADDEPITNAHFLFGERMVFAFREDVMSYPKPMLRDLVAQRLDQYREKTGAEPHGEIRHKAELAVRAELRRKILPRSKVVDVLWDHSRAELRFFSRGKGVVERFTKLFEQTFSMQLREKTFADLAISAELSLREKGMLEGLRPHEIFALKQRVEAEAYG